MKTRLLPLLIALLVSACNSSQAKNSREIVIGATVGDFSDLVNDGLKPLLEKKGFQVRLVQFTDYVQPNIALEEKALDVNIFQHKPYLDEFSKFKGLHLATLAEVPTAPLGLYAGKKKFLTQIANGDTVAVPNDPTNLARSLKILVDLKWITLKPVQSAIHVGVGDIQSNPYQLKIVQLEAAQLPRALGDVDFAVINGNYVVSSGIELSSSLAREKDRDFINWAVVRDADVTSPSSKAIVESLNSVEFKAFAQSRFKGYQFPQTW